MSDEGLHSYAVIARHTGDSSPSLEPALLRADQAHLRMQDLWGTVDQLRARGGQHPLKIRVKKHYVDSGIWAEPKLEWHYDEHDHQLQEELRSLAGEVLFHLRTSLEYLVYHLVWQDRGRPSKRSQFPVVSDDQKSRWSTIVKERLPGMATKNVEQIRQLQPFAGCEWTKRLADLNNVDKHRSPIRVAVAVGAEFSMDLTPAVIDPRDPTWCIVETTPTVEVKTHDGEPLQKTLEDLFAGVAQTLKAFSSALPGPGPDGVTITR